MPNYCDYDMKIVGTKKAINRVIECLKADYDYGVGKPLHKHFFRVFECEPDKEFTDEGNGKFSKTIWGYCAWSVSSCMLNSKSSYYNDVKTNHPDIFMGTDLAEQSRDCTIEVFSEETGMGFSEHYIFRNGECLIDDCVEIEQGGYDKDGNPTTDIDWETYGGDCLIFNPHRYGIEEGFKWES